MLQFKVNITIPIKARFKAKLNIKAMLKPKIKVNSKVKVTSKSKPKAKSNLIVEDRGKVGLGEREDKVQFMPWSVLVLMLPGANVAPQQMFEILNSCYA
jgi:hypothetical protein